MLETKTNTTRLECTTSRHDFTRLGGKKNMEASIKPNFMPHHRHKPTESKSKNKNEGREEVQSDLLHDLLDWRKDFRENLVDESSPTEQR